MSNEEKNNLLLKLEGEAKWKYEIETAEKMVLGNQCHVERPQREVGIDFDDTVNATIPSIRAWALPRNFCPKCDRNDITDSIGLDGTARQPSAGTWIVDKPMPGLDVTVGDVVLYYVCPSCAFESVWGMGNPGVLVGSDGKPLEDPATKYQKRAIEYIYAMKLRGETLKEIASV